MRYSHGSTHNDRVIRKLIGSACYVEIASKMKKWQFNQLEYAIFDHYDNEQSGYFSRLTRGVLPNNKTLKKIKKLEVLKGKKSQIYKWQTHAFWRLLKLEELTSVDIDMALSTVIGKVKKLVWNDYETTDSRFKTRNDEINRSCLLEIKSQKNLSALIALIALAREGYESRHIRNYLNPASHALEIFPDVMMQCPHLYIRWRVLAKRLTKVLWKPKNYIFEYSFNLDSKLEELGSRIEKLDTEYRLIENHKLPPKNTILHFNPKPLDFTCKTTVFLNLDLVFIEKLQSEYNFTTRDIAGALQISHQVFLEKIAQGYLTLLEAEQLKVLEALLSEATFFFINSKDVIQWLNKPDTKLDGKTPLQHMKIKDGLEEVRMLLFTLRYDAYYDAMTDEDCFHYFQTALNSLD